MNSLSIVGRLGKDPEIKYFDNGNIVCNATMAVRKRVKGAEGTDWFNLEAWGKTAELLNDFVKKGDMVAIVGAMTSDQYTAKDGSQRTKWFVKVREMTLVERKKRDGQQQQSAPVVDVQTQQGASQSPQYVEAPIF